MEAAERRETVTWWVGFMARAVDGGWWSRRLRPGYTHCWAARRLWAGCWLWVEWNHNGVTVGPITAAGVARMVGLATEVVVVRRERSHLPQRWHLPRFGMMHCSVLLGHMLGLRRYATPWRVRREVVALGGRVIRSGHGKFEDAWAERRGDGAEAASA